MGPCTFRGWMESQSHVKVLFFFTHVRLELKLERLVVGQGERIENYMCPIARIRWWRLVSSFIVGGGGGGD